MRLRPETNTKNTNQDTSKAMSGFFMVPAGSGEQSTQIKYLSKSTDTYNKILLQ